MAVTAVLAMLCVSGASPVLAQPSEREAEARVDAISRDIQALSRRLDNTRQAHSDASRQLEAVETALADIHQRLDALHAERRRLDQEVEGLEQRRQELEAEHAEQRQALGRQLDAMYRLGRSPQLKLLLNQDDPARLDRLQTYLNYLSRARNERLEALDRLNVRLAENRASLERQRQRLDSVAAELEDQSATLAERLRERETLVARLDVRHADEQARLQELGQDRAAAEQTLERIREELKRLEQPPPSTAISETRGTLPWPVQGSVLSAFGSGDGVNRNGLLIAAAEGTAIKAIHSGRVVFADWMRGFGNLLILDHGDDMMSLYAHVQRFNAAVGERVERDDVIAAVGNTGGRSSPALYFEVRRDGAPIDPVDWVAKR